MKKVRKIEVVKNSIEKCRKKVAAYCRVSTKYESQKSSIDLQISYYTSLIDENPEWDNAGIYIDYGSRLSSGRLFEPAFFRLFEPVFAIK